MNDSLILPDRVEVQLLDRVGNHLRLAGVIIYFSAYARHKNNYNLGPFASDENSLISIDKKELETEVDSTHDSGLMDYAGISQCDPKVRGEILNKGEVDRVVSTRREVWTSLLPSEERRFDSIDDLIEVYETSPNANFNLKDDDRYFDLYWAKTNGLCRIEVNTGIEQVNEPKR